MPVIGRPRTYHHDRPATGTERSARCREIQRQGRQTTQAGREVYHRSTSVELETPQPFFDALDAEFHFTLDVCATPENAKCARYFTRDDDGLAQDWGQGICWCNPPYGPTVGRWMQKADESAQQGATVVCLVKVVTTNDWWDPYVKQRDDVEKRWQRKRLKFGGSPNNAPFDSVVIIFRPPLPLSCPPLS
jgi:phage N-6-adenine-methyltransferase